MVTKGRQRINSMFPLKVLIVCVWSHGMCVFSKLCEPNKVVNVSRFDPPRRLWTVLKPLIPKKFSDDCGVSVRYTADKETEHLCFQQLANLTYLNDSNLELKVYDGNNFKTDLKPGQRLFKGEYCSDGRSLQFQLRSINTLIEPETDLLYITFQVVHIESPFRIISLDKQFCDMDIKIANSRVRVYNTISKMEKEFKNTCLITLVKVLQERQLCLFYMLRSQEWAQRFDWDIYVSIVKYSLSPEDVVYKFNARNESSGKWCDEANRENLFIVYRTNQSQLYPSEPPVFRMLVTDVGNMSDEGVTFATQWWLMAFDYPSTQPPTSLPNHGFRDTVRSQHLEVSFIITMSSWFGLFTFG
uniref:CUB domain-containing protein n=1 Tax=Biomphalaria glabrata TaxID=6526 RepID=A0A2C9KGI8_BIOGL